MVMQEEDSSVSRNTDTPERPVYGNLTQQILDRMEPEYASTLWISTDANTDLIEESFEIGDESQIHATCTTEIDEHPGLGIPFMRMSLRLVLPDSASWMNTQNADRLEARFNLFNTAIETWCGRSRMDILETGQTEHVQLRVKKVENNNSPAVDFVIAEIIDPDPQTDNWFDPAAYFTDPATSYEILRSQLIDKVPEIAEFISYGPVHHNETYAIASDATLHGIQTAVTTEGDTDRIEYNIPSPFGEGKMLPGALELSLSPDEELIANINVQLPGRITKTFKKVSLETLRQLWNSYQTELHNARIPRSDDVASYREIAAQLTFGADNTLQLISTDGMAIEHGVIILRFFRNPVDFFQKTHGNLIQSLARMELFSKTLSVWNPQTWRILATNPNTTFHSSKESGPRDRITAEIIDGNEIQGVVEFHLSIVEEAWDKDGMWLMDASSRVDCPLDFGETGEIDEVSLQTLWEAHIRKSILRTDSLGSFEGMKLRIVPVIRTIGEKEKGVFLTVVEEDAEGERSDVFEVNRYRPNHPERFVKTIQRHMADTVEAFREYSQTQLSADFRELLSNTRRTIPWLIRAVDDKTISPLVSITIPDHGFIINVHESGVKEACRGLATFKGVDGEYPLSLGYDPSGMGITVSIDLPTTLQNVIDAEDPQVTRGNISRIKQVITGMNLILFPHDQWDIQNFARCLPTFKLFAGKNSKLVVRLNLTVDTGELQVLHSIGNHYWDELIIAEMFRNVHLAVGLWVTQLKKLEL
jgi:hypothetical protein